jgi:hypothetical protein
MVLRLEVAESALQSTKLYRSIVGQPIQYFRAPEGSYRVVAGEPDDSVVLGRMKERGTKQQMPPLGTELTDDAGLELVSDWIAALPGADERSAERN